jgi:hypothetical protein
MDGKKEKDELELRREAIQIAAQLPHDPRDAKRVLALARFVVTDFFEKAQVGGSDVATLVPSPAPEGQSQV